MYNANTVFFQYTKSLAINTLRFLQAMQID